MEPLDFFIVISHFNLRFLMSLRRWREGEVPVESGIRASVIMYSKYLNRTMHGA